MTNYLERGISYDEGPRVGVKHTENLSDFEVSIQSEKERQAFEFVLARHGDQKRKDGSLYVTHLVAVASIIRNLGIDDEDVVCAAILHDVVEDTGTSLEELEVMFGKKVARFVDGVSKFKTRDGAESDFETLRKVVQTSYLEPEVGLIKLADRLHNMRTLGFMSPEKQIAKADETLKVYVGLAEAYGLWIIKTELEDLSFMYLKPEHYREVRAQIDADPRVKRPFLENHMSVLQEVLNQMGIRGVVRYRLKGYYEADKKRNREARKGLVSGDSFVDIPDIVSFRVILDDEQPDYPQLGRKSLCNMVWGQISEAFNDDALSITSLHARPNGYQALQAALHSDFGPYEVAVMTDDMERFNNYGLAWKMQHERVTLGDYVKKIVFTPQGKIKFVCKEATGYDVACSIDPMLMAQAESIYIQVREGEEVRELEMDPAAVVPNGALVRVILGEPRRAPDREALHYAASPETRATMLQQFTMDEWDRAVSEGRKLMQGVLSPRGILSLEVLETMDEESHLALLAELGMQSRNELYADVGAGRLEPQMVAGVLDKLKIDRHRHWSTVVFEGKDRAGVLHKLSGIVGELGISISVVNNFEHEEKYQVIFVMKGMTDGQRVKLESALNGNEVKGYVDQWGIYPK